MKGIKTNVCHIKREINLTDSLRGEFKKEKCKNCHRKDDDKNKTMDELNWCNECYIRWFEPKFKEAQEAVQVYCDDWNLLKEKCKKEQGAVLKFVMDVHTRAIRCGVDWQGDLKKAIEKIYKRGGVTNAPTK